ncbi:hypothetical protein KC850_00970 [Candidatus Kaiserbacteria bacterium]|nr:hypothetical protein [Candidatus Kaiserbacteria bacterium]
MNSVHHAELVRSNAVRIHEVQSLTDDSEVFDIYIERFGIDDARELVRKAHNRPSNSSFIYLTVRTEFITHEAQNALLKVLEEPPASSRLIFVVPPDLTLLPTLESRFSDTASNNEIQTLESKETFDKFIGASYADRLSMIEVATKGKDIEWQRCMKQGLTYHLMTCKKDETLSDLEYSVRTLLTRGASNKMLFEHIALIL